MPIPSHQFFASCAKGLEDLLQEELVHIGQRAGVPVSVAPARGGVSFTSDLAFAYRACMWSRVASRILFKLKDFDVKDDDDLYTEVGSVDWSVHLDADSSLAIDCFSAHSKLNNSHYAMLRSKDAVVDQFQQSAGRRPDIEREQPDVRINVYLHDDGCSLYIDLSGDALHKRGYRKETVGAPLRETLAAGLLYRSKWADFYTHDKPFYDPMCGSATLLVEAAMMASDTAPGLLRERFGFHGWKQHDDGLWREIRDEAEARREAGIRSCPVVIGSDIDEKAVGAARKNIIAAGFEASIRVYLHDATEPLKKTIKKYLEHAPGLILCNPPYGKRLGEQQVLRSTYMRFGKQLRKEFPGWTVAMITSDQTLARSVGLRAFKKNTFYNGAIKSTLYQYRIGEKKQTQAPGPSSDVEAETDSAPEQDVGAGSRSGAGQEHAAMFRNRLSKNYRHLKKWARKNDIECYRVYDADIPQYAVAIDLYADWVHVQEYRAPKSVDQNRAFQRINDVLDVVADVLETTPEKVVLKVRQKQSGASQYQKQDDVKRRISVHEGGLEFLVNLHDYLDTGLFLDHRDTRSLVRKLAQGKSFLNLFAYTGSVSVYAAAGGASSTTTVDMSNTYLNWAKHNMMANGFIDERYEYIRDDCMKWIAEAIDQGSRYDLIFVDPPTFSNSKSMDTTLDIIRDHVALLGGCLALLEDDGRIIFSTNAKGFRMSDEMSEMCHLKEITVQTTTEDFRRKPLHRSWMLVKQQELL